jgi:hypothetical protein
LLERTNDAITSNVTTNPNIKMNRYGQLRDLLLGDLTASIFIFGLVVTLLVIASLVLSSKEREDYDKDYYDRHGSLPK